MNEPLSNSEIAKIGARIQEYVDAMNKEFLTQFEELRCDITLGLSFWDNFRREILSITDVAKDPDGRPYFSVEERAPGLTERPPDVEREVQQLTVTCGSFEFAAALDPMSLAMIYAIQVADFDSIFEKGRIPIRRGVIAVSRRNQVYTVDARPRIEELSLEKMDCSYEEFWKVAAQIGRWACGSITLYRLGVLRNLTSAETV